MAIDRPRRFSTSSSRSNNNNNGDDNDYNNNDVTIIRDIFGRDGPCWGKFACSWQRMSGTLYVTSTALLFYSSLLLGRKLVVEFDTIQDMQLIRTTSIQLILVDHSKDPIIFRSFSHRVHVLEQLKDFQRRYQENYQINQQVTPTNGRSQGRQPISRVNSRLIEDVLEGPSARRNHPSDDPSESEGNEARPILVNSNNNNRSFNRRRALSEPVRFSIDEASQQDNAKHNAPLPRSDSTSSFNDEWEAALQESHQFSNPALQLEELACSVAEFWERFLRDGAVFGLDVFQRDVIQDGNVVLQRWKEDDANDHSYQRLLSFEHPIRVGWGPSKAVTQRHQKVQRFPRGLLLRNTTTVQGVPGADCFCLEDLWIVQENNESDKTVQLSTFFRLTFSKRSLFRSIIETSVSRETSKWFVRYACYVRDALSSASPLTSASPPPVHDTTHDILACLQSLYPLFVVGLLVLLLILFLQCFQLYFLRATVSELQLLKAEYQQALLLQKLATSGEQGACYGDGST